MARTLGHNPKTWLEVLWVMWKAWDLAAKEGKTFIFGSEMVKYYNQVVGEDHFGLHDHCPGCRKAGEHEECKNTCKVAKGCNHRKTWSPAEMAKWLKGVYNKEAKKRGKRI